MATDFEVHPFAEGRFRLAYKGAYTAPQRKVGKQCVVKKMKDSYSWKKSDWKETLGILKTCKKLATEFNKYSNTNRPIKFTDVEVSQVSRVAPSTKVKLDEFITVEEYIPGDYVKWCNNYGSITAGSKSMPAFMHWSWAHTKGETMIADLQGVREEKAYYLTDPCLLSATHGGKYGRTDMGIEGMAMFFLNHTCTDFCKNIPKPRLRGISKQEIVTALKTQQLISTSTAYLHEISLPKEIRDVLIPAFKQIARTAKL